jgi:nucleoside-diphosphate-sugar epimerase
MILVVGATGQVGSTVVRRLRERGEDVTALVRPATIADPIAATGARIVQGDLRDPGSLRSVCSGAELVVATASAIVPRRGEKADFDAIADGYRELGRLARAAGVRRFLFVSVPREFMGHKAEEFDAKARIEEALSVEGPPLTVVRASLLMEVWLPWLGSRLPLRGSRQATLERGFWFTRLAGSTFQRSLDRFGLALLPGDGTARHAFIAIDDVADSLVAAALSGGELGEEVRLGGPESPSWREVAESYGRVLKVRVRALRQPVAPFRALSVLARPLSAAASQLLAAAAIVATVDSAYPPDDTRRLLGRDPISVEAFLRQRLADR